jgi:hypothetical protein
MYKTIYEYVQYIVKEFITYIRILLNGEHEEFS